MDDDHEQLYDAVASRDVPGASAINNGGEVAYEGVFPYGREGNGRSYSHDERAERLGPYCRHVVDRLIAHFDPEDRGHSVGRKAMRKYAYNLMNEHGVRAYDIATHVDRIVVAAVARVDARRQAWEHNIVLELGGPDRMRRAFERSSF